MKHAAVAVLAVLGALAPLASGQGAETADLQAASAYAVGGAGALAPLAGLPSLGADASPAFATAASLPLLSYEQGRSLRPAGLAMAWWAGDAALWLDAGHGAALDDGTAFATAWSAWAGAAPETPVPLHGPSLPTPARIFHGPAVAVQKSPADATSSDDLRIVADIASPFPNGRIREAHALLRAGDEVRDLPMVRDAAGRWTATLSRPAPGPRTLWVEALDEQLSVPAGSPAFAAGIWFLGAGRSETLSFTVRDALPPRVVLDGPAYTNLTVAAVLANLTDDVGVTAARVVPWAWGAPADSYNVTLAEDGPAVVTIEARDAAGNVGRGTVTVVRDTSGPAAGLSDAGTDAWRRAPANLTLAPGSSLAPARIAVTTDGSDPRNASLEEEVALHFDDGEVLVRARARDLAGNWGSEVTRWVRVDRAAPIIDFALADGWLTQRATLRPNASDALSGLGRFTVAASDGTALDAEGFTLPDGVHTLTLTATDVAGNVATLTRTAKLDTVAPATALTVAGTTADPVVRWASSDATSGVADVRLFTRAPGGAWQPAKDGGAAGEFTLHLAPGSRLDVRAIARDVAGNAEGDDAAVRTLVAPPLPVAASSGGASGATSAASTSSASSTAASTTSGAATSASSTTSSASSATSSGGSSGTNAASSSSSSSAGSAGSSSAATSSPGAAPVQVPVEVARTTPSEEAQGSQAATGDEQDAAAQDEALDDVGNVPEQGALEGLDPAAPETKDVPAPALLLSALAILAGAALRRRRA